MINRIKHIISKKRMKQQQMLEKFNIDNELIFNEMEEVQLDCKVGKIENLFSPFDIAKDRTITEAFHTYLMQETEIIPIRYNLELKLHIQNNYTEEEKEKIGKAIKRHYSFMITSANVRLRKTLFRSLMLYLGGLISLLLNFAVNNFLSELPLKETLLIISWFFVWEATGVLFFDRGSLKRRRHNMFRIYNAKVSFVEEDLEV